VIARRSGEFELVVYSAADPDTSRLVVQLNSEEADTLAEILGAPRIAERFTCLPEAKVRPSAAFLSRERVGAQVTQPHGSRHRSL
jgi:TrkA domain protein